MKVSSQLTVGFILTMSVAYSFSDVNDCCKVEPFLMPWIKQSFSIFKSNTTLEMKLDERHKVTFVSRILISPFSMLTWLLLLTSLIGVPLLLMFVLQASPDAILPVTLISIAVILIFHCWVNFKSGLVTSLTKEALELPEVFCGSKTQSYIRLSRISAIHIQRYRFSYKRETPGKWYRQISKADIYTHARFMLNTGEKINISRANLFALPEIIEYINDKHSPEITFAYPTPLKVLLGLFLLYLVGLYLSK